MFELVFATFELASQLACAAVQGAPPLAEQLDGLPHNPAHFIFQPHVAYFSK